MSSKLTLPAYTYYYGFGKEQIISLASIQYEAALHIKIAASKALLHRLLDRPFTEQDTTRTNDVAKAIKFNEELLTELKV